MPLMIFRPAASSPVHVSGSCSFLTTSVHYHEIMVPAPSQLSAHSVLERMAEHVRKGEFEAAVACGNACTVPLALPEAAVRGRHMLGSGTESVIRAGELDEAPVAMKKAVIRTPADLQRFRREVGILSSLSHSGIISLLAARALPPTYTMVLPRYTGSLEAILHERGWRPQIADVMTISTCLVDAVAAVHAAGLVHRDIKPGNVLLSEQGTCVLSDFGLAETAKALKEAHVTGPTGGFHKQRTVGTLQYLPPEVLMGRFHTQTSDVYALAVTLNELATATRPFADCTKDNPACHTVLDANYSDLDLRAAVVAEHLRPCVPQGYPPAWSLLMQSCWQAAPEDRPTCTAILQALRSMCSEEGIEVPAAVQLPAQPDDPEGACSAPAREGWSELEDSPMSTASDDTVAVCVPDWQQTAVTSASQRQVQPAMLCGSYADVGMRDSMEDRHVAAVPLRGLQQVSLLAVFDGHRGHTAAHTAAQTLPTRLREQWSRRESAGHALCAALADCEECVLAHGQHAWDRRVAAAGAGAGARQWPGCTALAAVQYGDVISFANVGDCRAVMCRRGEAVQVTRDHVVGDEQEMQRLRGVGAKLQQGPDGVWRVGAAQLQVSRSLGDGDVKGAAGVSAEAELSTVLLDGDDEFVIMATDGLWDVLSNEDAVAIVHDTVKNPSMAAKRLSMEALARGSQDNVTTLVCFFKDVGTLESIYRDGKQKYSVARSFYGSRVELMAALSKGRAADEVVEQL